MGLPLGQQIKVGMYPNEMNDSALSNCKDALSNLRIINHWWKQKWANWWLDGSVESPLETGESQIINNSGINSCSISQFLAKRNNGLLVANSFSFGVVLQQTFPPSIKISWITGTDVHPKETLIKSKLINMVWAGKQKYKRHQIKIWWFKWNYIVFVSWHLYFVLFIATDLEFQMRLIPHIFLLLLHSDKSGWITQAWPICLNDILRIFETKGTWQLS